MQRSKIFLFFTFSFSKLVFSFLLEPKEQKPKSFFHFCCSFHYLIFLHSLSFPFPIPIPFPFPFTFPFPPPTTGVSSISSFLMKQKTNKRDPWPTHLFDCCSGFFFLCFLFFLFVFSLFQRKG